MPPRRRRRGAMAINQPVALKRLTANRSQSRSVDELREFVGFGH